MVNFAFGMQKHRFILFFLLLFTQCQKQDGIREDLAPVLQQGQRELLRSGQTTIQPGKSTSKKITAAYPRKSSAGLSSGSAPDSGQKNSGTSRYSDSSLLSQRLRILRTKGTIPDFNEPSTRRIFEDPTGTIPYESMIEVSPDAYLNINFDNDILNYTDRFYTNGIRIELFLPAFRFNPLSRLMIPYGKRAKSYYGLSLVQNMYTPSTTKTGGIHVGDRPYSAYLYVGSSKITNDVRRSYRQTSEIGIGIIGPDSYGEWVQRSFHSSVPTNNEPLGWEYQIQNDLFLNYFFTVEKGISNGNHLELILNSKIAAGTVYDHISAGLHFRAGILHPWFATPGVLKPDQIRQAGLKKFRILFYAKANGQLVGYDATLQGGMFNRSSVYTIPSEEISRLVFSGSAGITVGCPGFGIDVEQFLLSPEFQGEPWHKWVHIALRMAL